MSIGGLDRSPLETVSEPARSPVQTDLAGPKSEEKSERSLTFMQRVVYHYTGQVAVLASVHWSNKCTVITPRNSHKATAHDAAGWPGDGCVPPHSPCPGIYPVF